MMSDSVERISKAAGQAQKANEMLSIVRGPSALENSAAGQAPGHLPYAHEAADVDGQPHRSGNKRRQEREGNGRPSHERRVGITVFETVDVAAIQEPRRGAKINLVPLAMLFQNKRNRMHEQDDRRQQSPRM